MEDNKHFMQLLRSESGEAPHRAQAAMFFAVEEPGATAFVRPAENGPLALHNGIPVGLARKAGGPFHKSENPSKAGGEVLDSLSGSVKELPKAAPPMSSKAAHSRNSPSGVCRDSK